MRQTIGLAADRPWRKPVTKTDRGPKQTKTIGKRRDSIELAQNRPDERPTVRHGPA